MHKHICTKQHLMKKRGHNLKQSKDGYMGMLGGRKGNGEMLQL